MPSSQETQRRVERVMLAILIALRDKATHPYERAILAEDVEEHRQSMSK